MSDSLKRMIVDTRKDTSKRSDLDESKSVRKI